MKTVREVADYIRSKQYNSNPFNFSRAVSMVAQNLESDEEILFACVPYYGLCRMRENKDGRAVVTEIKDLGQGVLVITNQYATYVKSNKFFRKPVIAVRESMWSFLKAESSDIDNDQSAIIFSFRASQISLCIPSEKREEMWKDAIQAIERSEHKTRVEGLKKFAELFGIPTDKPELKKVRTAIFDTPNDKPEWLKAHEDEVERSLKELRNMIR